MARTLMLSPDWDLTLTRGGRIALTDGAYAIAQNVANAVRLFLNDAYFNATSGVPHYNVELGNMPAEGLLKSRLRKAALSVDGVAEAQVVFTEYSDRVLTGKIILTLENGETANVDL